MATRRAPHRPPFCPNPACAFHTQTRGWRWKRAGFHARQHAPRRVQRYRCQHCRRHFSDQTFRTSYWLKRPDLLADVFAGLVGCAAFRQLARARQVSPSTIATHAARLGRHCLLFHQRHRPRGAVREPQVLDSFQSFEYSQYSPTLFHLAGGRHSHFFHGFTDSERRRSGSMRPTQKRRRAALEAAHGRPDPRSVEREVRALLGIVYAEPQSLRLHTDEHVDYRRAIATSRHLRVEHRTISSRAARTRHNPLFAVNLLDLLIRHSSANHKRETIAFSKRRQSAAERLWVFLVWRNYMKWFSERRRGQTPAMRAGVLDRRVDVRELLGERLFVSRVGLPARWQRYYRRQIPTRRIPHCRTHRAVFAL